jgi:hypothetical protein
MFPITDKAQVVTERGQRHLARLARAVVVAEFKKYAARKILDNIYRNANS